VAGTEVAKAGTEVAKAGAEVMGKCNRYNNLAPIY